MIIVNLKTYVEITKNNKGVELAQVAQQVFDQYQVPLILCVQTPDIYKMTQTCSLPIFAQHIDPIEPGRNTGFISALDVKENGAFGVLINHSEHRIGMDNIAKNLEIAKTQNLEP